MFFTRAARVLAWLAIIYAVVRIALAVFVIQSGDPSLVHRYIGSGTTGQAIDRALYVLVFGIALGVLADISRSVAKATDTR